MGQLQHVQYRHVGRVSPVEENTSMRFFLSPLPSAVSMKEHSEGVMISERISPNRAFRADVRNTAASKCIIIRILGARHR